MRMRTKASGSQVWHADTNPTSSTGILLARPTKSTVGPSNVEYLKKAYSCERPKLGHPQEVEMEQINTNAMIWRLFTASMKAAVHLGKGYEENLRTTKNTDFDEIKPSFNITRNLILDQEHKRCEISTIHWCEIPWMRGTQLHEDAIKFSTVRVYVFSDSVLCLGSRIAEYPHSVQSWQNRIEWFTQTSPPGSPKQDGERKHSARRIQRSNHLHVDVQRH